MRYSSRALPSARPMGSRVRRLPSNCGRSASTSANASGSPLSVVMRPTMTPAGATVTTALARVSPAARTISLGTSNGSDHIAG
jgi:hypothetical protein